MTYLRASSQPTGLGRRRPDKSRCALEGGLGERPTVRGVAPKYIFYR